VLLGHHKTPAVLDVDDYAWVSSGVQPVRRYHLDPSELQRLPSTDRIVGYFRTQSQDNLHLRDEEISFVRNYFPDPTKVALLIQTSTQPYTAGFFFWMKEGVFAPLSFMDFPLSAEILRNQTESDSSVAGAMQAEEEMRKTSLFPAITAQDAAPPAKCAAHSDEGSISATNKDMTIGAWPKSHMEPLPKCHSISTSAASQLNQTGPSETTRTTTFSNKKAPRVAQRILIASSVVFAMLALVALSAFLLRDHSLTGGRQNARSEAGFPLQLDVEARGNGLDIRWNPQSGPVTQAREGHLVIVEGDSRPRIIPLSAEELASGHVYYRSFAKRVHFQLEIADSAGKVSKQSVLALSSMPSPGPRRVTPPQTSSTDPGRGTEE